MGDEAGGEAEEGFVDVITSLPADAETSEAVEPGDRALDNPAVNSEARTVQNTASGDDRFDAPSPDQAAVLAVDRAGAAFGPRRAARTWEESITARDQSSCFAARSLASSTTWSRSQTPASFQAASRRQHVMPEPKPSSCGRYSHWIPVCSTNRVPHRAWRSGTLGRPGISFGAGTGNNGSTNNHSSSETIHGRSPRTAQRASKPTVTSSEASVRTS